MASIDDIAATYSSALKNDSTIILATQILWEAAREHAKKHYPNQVELGGKTSYRNLVDRVIVTAIKSSGLEEYRNDPEFALLTGNLTAKQEMLEARRRVLYVARQILKDAHGSNYQPGPDEVLSQSRELVELCMFDHKL